MIGRRPSLLGQILSHASYLRALRCLWSRHSPLPPHCGLVGHLPLAVALQSRRRRILRTPEALRSATVAPPVRKGMQVLLLREGRAGVDAVPRRPRDKAHRLGGLPPSHAGVLLAVRRNSALPSKRRLPVEGAFRRVFRPLCTLTGPGR